MLQTLVINRVGGGTLVTRTYMKAVRTQPHSNAFFVIRNKVDNHQTSSKLFYIKNYQVAKLATSSDGYKFNEK